MSDLQKTSFPKTKIIVSLLGGHSFTSVYITEEKFLKDRDRLLLALDRPDKSSQLITLGNEFDCTVFKSTDLIAVSFYPVKEEQPKYVFPKMTPEQEKLMKLQEKVLEKMAEEIDEMDEGEKWKGQDDE